MARIIPTTLALLMLATGVAHADTLLLASIDSDKQSVDSRPKPGMSMTAVESSYGAPAQRHPASGSITAQDLALAFEIIDAGWQG